MKTKKILAYVVLLALFFDIIGKTYVLGWWSWYNRWYNVVKQDEGITRKLQEKLFWEKLFWEEDKNQKEENQTSKNESSENQDNKNQNNKNQEINVSDKVDDKEKVENVKKVLEDISSVTNTLNSLVNSKSIDMSVLWKSLTGFDTTYDPSKVAKFSDIRSELKDIVGMYKNLSCYLSGSSTLCSNLKTLHKDIDNLKTINDYYKATLLVKKYSLEVMKEMIKLNQASSLWLWGWCDLLDFLGDSVVKQLFNNPKLPITTLASTMSTCSADKFVHYYKMMMWDNCNGPYKDKAINMLASMTDENLLKYYDIIYTNSSNLAYCTYKEALNKKPEIFEKLMKQAIKTKDCSQMEKVWMYVTQWYAQTPTFNIKSLVNISLNEYHTYYKCLIDSDNAKTHTYAKQLYKFISDKATNLSEWIIWTFKWEWKYYVFLLDVLVSNGYNFLVDIMKSLSFDKTINSGHYSLWKYIVDTSDDTKRIWKNTYLFLLGQNQDQLTKNIMNLYIWEWKYYSYFVAILFGDKCNGKYKSKWASIVNSMGYSDYKSLIRWMLDSNISAAHCVYAEVGLKDNEGFEKDYQFMKDLIDEEYTSYTDGIENHTDVINGQNLYIQRLFKKWNSQLNTQLASKLIEKLYDDGYLNTLNVWNKYRNFINGFDDAYLLWAIWWVNYDKQQEILYNAWRICVAGIVMQWQAYNNYKWDPASRMPCMLPISYQTYYSWMSTQSDIEEMKSLYDREDVYLYTYEEDENGIQRFWYLVWPLENYKQIYKLAFVRGLWLERWKDWLNQSGKKSEFCNMVKNHVKANEEPIMIEDVYKWIWLTKNEYESWCE